MINQKTKKHQKMSKQIQNLKKLEEKNIKSVNLKKNTSFQLQKKSYLFFNIRITQLNQSSPVKPNPEKNIEMGCE